MLAESGADSVDFMVLQLVPARVSRKMAMANRLVMGEEEKETTRKLSGFVPQHKPYAMYILDTYRWRVGQPFAEP